ncbi:hypothetical protein AVEN_187257-1 [Araneus ventricosus]|uniref:Uncharacterized protein n=1 Tax=Araneus ventricosus TaxID=182803 RepID=A0A4Y2KU23_ARAVE|nr:hypothetical protein AVEN_187257-1 [Araneus ventricosus]
MFSAATLQQLLLFLYHIYGLKDVSSSAILANCEDLETILTDGESSDINSLEFCNEISVVCANGHTMLKVPVLVSGVFSIGKRYTTFGSFEIDNKNEFCSTLEHCLLY